MGKLRASRIRVGALLALFGLGASAFAGDPMTLGLLPTAPRSVVGLGFAEVEEGQPVIVRAQMEELPAPHGMSLDQVINACLLADPKLRAGFEAINQARGDALTSSLRPNPELFTDAQLLPLARPFTPQAQGGPPQQDVNLSYPIDWFLFGKRAAAMQASAFGVRVAEATYADLIRQRVLDATIAYYDVLEAKALLNLAHQDVENFKRVEAAVDKAVKGAGRAPIELKRIQLDRLKSEQTLRDAETNLVRATSRLRALIGRSDSDPAFDVAGTLEMLTYVELPPADEAFSLALDNRPDINALRFKIDKAHADIELERRKAFPTVTPQMGYTRQYQRDIGFPDASSYMFGLTMSLPFSDRNQGNRAKAASVAVQNHYEFELGLVDLRAEVVQSLQELRAARANSDSVARDQLKLAIEVRDAITKAYEAGGRPLLDLLDAQRNYRETYRLYINSRANYGRASMKFNAALGKKVVP